MYTVHVDTALECVSHLLHGSGHHSWGQLARLVHSRWDAGGQLLSVGKPLSQTLPSQCLYSGLVIHEVVQGLLQLVASRLGLPARHRRLRNGRERGN